MSMPNCAEAVAAEAVRLTVREREVLALVIEGNSNSDVGDSLYISRRTVEFHLRVIYSKLNVHNRIGAWHAAIRLGLIRPMTA